MKIALINAGYTREPSMYYEGGKFYRTDGIEYTQASGIRNFFNVIECLECEYIRWIEDDLLPPVDFDIILIANDSGKKNINILRKVYPNAQIIAYVKEKNPAYYLTHPRAHFFSMCDKIALPYSCNNVMRLGQNSVWMQVHPMHNYNVYSLPYPYNIEKIRKQYNKGMKQQILVSNNNSAGRGFEETQLFACYISEKYKLDVICPNVDYDEWLKMVSESFCCISLDPSHEIGQIPIECAILGTPFIGSNMDAAEELWDSISGINQDNLELAVQNILDNFNYQFLSDIAYKKVTERHSFESFRKTFSEVVK